ncbi:MAG: hypothetical protein FJY88_13805 [Candidatus Eisenbacteria bacterium]|nr:hypothetical protein [Candidatus Eisenbacteria bacterium]
MSEAQREILRLVAEGKITLEEAERMLNALRPPAGAKGEAQDTGAKGEAQGAGAKGQETVEGESEAWQAQGKRVAEGVAQIMQEVGETVRRTVEDAVAATQRAFEEHRPTTEAVPIKDGRIEIPAGARLKIQQAVRVSLGGGSKGGNVILRASQAGHLLIVRGEAIEAHHDGLDYVLTWAKGNLEMEIPGNLAGLDVRCMGGDLEIVQFQGAMTAETMGGELRVQSPRGIFRFRTLGGRVRIADLELKEGAASVSSAGGDVQIEVSAASSLTIRASTLGGTLDLPPESERERQGRARRRAVCVIGEGAAELRIDTLGGGIRIRRG